MEQYRTNVFGVINVTHAFLPHMRERGNGTIIVVGSRSGWKTQSAVSTFLNQVRAISHMFIILARWYALLTEK
jgi:NADP-dependent 3-hydroxy acid dehydrogenase YdfG